MLLALCAGPAAAGDKSYGALQDLRAASGDAGFELDAMKARFSALAAVGPKTETDRFLESHKEAAAKFQAMKAVHLPVARNWCSLCHASVEDALAMREDGNKLCLACHKPQNEPLKKAHMGVTTFAGQCTVCHDPHASDKPKILRAKGEHGGFSGCTDCHSGPSADGKPALKDPLAKACFECHSEIEGAMKDKVVHGALEMGACTGCHSPGNEQGARVPPQPALQPAQVPAARRAPGLLPRVP